MTKRPSQSNSQSNSNFKYATLYFDVDDVVIKSSETVISLLNEAHGINPKKTVNDIKDWDFKSVLPSITSQQLLSVFESEEFWKTIEPNPDFMLLMSSPFVEHYFIRFVSKGTAVNLLYKETFIHKLMSSFQNVKYEFIGLAMGTSKSTIDMSDGVQIDDNCYYLDTNAASKYLVKNHRETEYNQCPKNEDNFYTINTLVEFLEILKFDFEQEGNFLRGEY